MHDINNTEGSFQERVGSGQHPIIISGPCSAEYEEQVIATARGLASIDKVDLFRVGIWKPRTRPGAFEGVGRKGLDWAIKAREETGIPLAVEVANAKHVEEVLKAGVDVVWIGARTTVSPFSVQEVASALRGVDIPVMVKNPLNPDLGLWVGALERLSKEGVGPLAAIHRGFSTSDSAPYRNAPLWSIPIELKRQHPDLDVICDPSHIAGDRDLIPPISQKALDLDMQGLMIETHIGPDAAWSDKEQQLTPAALEALLDQLTIREADVPAHEGEGRMEQVREEIDRVDDAILRQLAARMELVERIGHFKRDNDITILQLGRWKELLRTRMEKGKEFGLDRELLSGLFELVHQASIQRQNEIMNEERPVGEKR